jgi:hypothetical protein
METLLWHIQISTMALNQLLKELSKRHSHFKTILLFYPTLSGLSEVQDDESCAYEKKYKTWNCLQSKKEFSGQSSSEIIQNFGLAV